MHFLIFPLTESHNKMITWQIIKLDNFIHRDFYASPVIPVSFSWVGLGWSWSFIGWGDVEWIIGLIRNSSSFCYRLLVVTGVIFFFFELQFCLLVSSSSVTVGSGDRNIITMIFSNELVKYILTYSDVPSWVPVPGSSPV